MKTTADRTFLTMMLFGAVLIVCGIDISHNTMIVIGIWMSIWGALFWILVGDKT